MHSNYTTPSLRSLTADEFCKRIEKLEGQAVRNMVGSTVWWDYFSHLPANKRDPRFTAYMNEVKWCAEEASYLDIVAGLVNVGYDPQKATERAKS